MRIFLLIAAFVVFFSATGNVQARQEGIALVVNDAVISRSNLEDRMKLIIVSSGLPNNKETRTQLLPQVIGTLIDEEIRMQEAEKLKLSVSSEEIAQGFVEIARQNNFTAEQFKATLKRGGINVLTLHRQIKAQLGWTKVVQSKLRALVIISDSDVDVWLSRVEKAKGQAEYLVSEIFLPVNKATEEAQVRQLAARLARDIRAHKVSFFKVAQEFSKAAGAVQGGNLGWIQQGQLSEELDQAIVAMGAERLSAPVRSLSGFHIFLVRERRILSEDTIPDRQAIRNMIGLERLQRQQRRYFLDLKSTAFIENRLESPS